MVGWNQRLLNNHLADLHDMQKRGYLPKRLVGTGIPWNE